MKHYKSMAFGEILECPPAPMEVPNGVDCGDRFV